VDANSRQIGRYVVDRELGRGGMGVVYLARDPHLDRLVAIKSIEESGALAGERVARFEREARTLAALNHPNIGAIHELERGPDGRVHLVLEYVDGETLVQRLRRGPMDVDEALDVCAQIAAGVEAAHDAGVVHRDLKPGNVKIAADGKVKVLDFGLAKSEPGGSASARASDLSASPTVTSPAHRSGPVTQPGMVMGTAPYMSPEQARGRPVDRRTDIWAFGCVLYECLTARSLFAGETVTDTLAAILEREIDLRTLPPHTPQRVRDLLRHCLERDPRRRLKDIGDARLTLESALSGREWTSTGAVAAAGGRARGRWSRRALRALPWAVAACALVAALVAWRARPAVAPEARRITFNVPLPPPIPGPNSDYALMQRLALSPDGRTLVIATGRGPRSELVAHDLTTGRAAPLQGSIDAAWPVFSPDGQRVAFATLGGELRAMPASGGLAETVCKLSSCRGLVWNDDGNLYFADSHAGGIIYRVPPRPAEPVALLTASGAPDDYLYRFPCPTPSGRAVLCVVAPGGPYSDAVIRAARVDTGESKVVLNNAFDPRFAPDGRLLFSRGEGVYIVGFDERTLATVGEPRPVLSDCVVDYGPLGVSHYVVGRDGTLAYIPGRFEISSNSILWVGMDGRTEEVLRAQSASGVRLSPDQRLIGFTNSQPVRGVAIYDFERDLLRSVPNSRSRAWFGAFDPDGLSFWYADRGPLGDRVMRGWLDQRSAPTALVSIPNLTGVSDVSPDGSSLLVWVSGGTDASAVVQVQTTDGSLQQVSTGSGRSAVGVYSPDGNWVAYHSNETGTYEIVARRTDLSGGRVQVSARGGLFPHWAPDGKALYYWRLHEKGGTLVKAPVRIGERVEVGREVDLFEADMDSPIEHGQFEMAADGTRFLMTSRVRDSAPSAEARVIVNWLTTLPEAALRQAQ
jgi:serine/threonine-protein kinase